MRILYINKFFHILGGVERYFFDLAELMKNQGHEIAFFSMKDERNKKSRWSKYFISNVSFEDKSINGRMRFLKRIFYSQEARQKISQLLDYFEPDIVHLHDIYHHISPSILLEIEKRKIPIVQTLGNYHLVSPNYNLFHDGKICEVIKKKRYYNAILHRCVKKSYLSSSIEVLEKYFHGKYINEEKLISKFISPSRFLKDKLIEYGVAKDKIVTIPHFVKDNYYEFKGLRPYILYFGRLEEEKGLNFLLVVMQGLPHITLKIAGKGSLNKELENKIKLNKLRNVKILGFCEGKELIKIIAGSRFTILPSLWYEVFGLSILESFILNRTILASRIGGIPEIMKNNINGMLFQPGNIDDCARKISILWQDNMLLKRLENNAYKDAKNRFSEERHYQKLIKIYKNVI